MKKMMTVLAACAVTSLALADSGVVSANVVGYNTVSLGANKLYMFGSNFEMVTNTSGHAVTLASLKASIGFEDLDTIQTGVADLSGKVVFTDYVYLSFMDPVGWYASDYSTYAGNVEIPAGVSVWMSLNTAQNVTSSGQVRPTSTVFTFLAGKLTMAASAYPIPFNPNVSCVWSGVQDLDNIQTGLANASGKVIFTDYVYLSFMDPAGWYASDYSTYAGNIVGVGQGFWANMQGTVTLTQSSPLQ